MRVVQVSMECFFGFGKNKSGKWRDGKVGDLANCDIDHSIFFRWQLGNLKLKAPIL